MARRLQPEATIMAEVIEINDVRQLDGYALLWQRLLRDTPGGSFFQSRQWLQAYWQHFGQGQKLRVLVVHSGGSPVGILPLTVITEPTRVGRMRVLTYPLDGWSTFYGPLGPDPAATLAAGLSHIRRTDRDWQLLDLRWVAGHAGQASRIAAAMQLAGFSVRQAVWTQTALVETRGGWPAYLANRTSRFRNELRRAERRAAGLGEVVFQRYRPPGLAQGQGDPRWDLYEACVELATRSWQGTSSDGTTLSHAAVRDFFRHTHRLAAEHGAVDLNLLWIDHRPVAFAYNYHWQGYVFGLRVGYDPQYGHAAVGKLLWARSLQDSFRRGDHTYEMGCESLEIKRPWLTRIAPSYRCTHYPPTTLHAQLLRLKHYLRPVGT